MEMHEVEGWVKKVEEALYALNRAIDPDLEYRSELQQHLVDARDKVWTVLCTLDPTRRD